MHGPAQRHVCEALNTMLIPAPPHQRRPRCEPTRGSHGCLGLMLRAKLPCSPWPAQAAHVSPTAHAQHPQATAFPGKPSMQLQPPQEGKELASLDGVRSAAAMAAAPET